MMMFAIAGRVNWVQGVLGLFDNEGSEQKCCIGIWHVRNQPNMLEYCSKMRFGSDLVYMKSSNRVVALFQSEGELKCGMFGI